MQHAHLLEGMRSCAPKASPHVERDPALSLDFVKLATALAAHLQRCSQETKAWPQTVSSAACVRPIFIMKVLLSATRRRGRRPALLHNAAIAALGLGASRGTCDSPPTRSAVEHCSKAVVRHTMTLLVAAMSRRSRAMVN